MKMIGLILSEGKVDISQVTPTKLACIAGEVPSIDIGGISYGGGYGGRRMFGAGR